MFNAIFLSFLVTFTSLFLSGKAQALPATLLHQGFSGSFKGTGKAADDGGWESNCTDISIAIVDSAEEVTITNQKYACGSLGTTHDPLHLMKKSDGLYLNDKKIGLYSPTEIDINLPSEHIKDFSFIMRLLVLENGLRYTEDWVSFQDGTYEQSFEMSGDLKYSF